MPEPGPHDVACPRCGYDQRGSVATWGNESCPLAGICSECGLRFEWGDLYNPYRQQCVGLYEHARGVRHRTQWFLRTIGWMIWPGVYWSRVQMHHVVRTRRLVWTVLAGMLAWHLLAAGVHAIGTSFTLPWWVGPWYPIQGWKGDIVYFHALMQPIAGVDWYTSRYMIGRYVAGTSEWITFATMVATGLALWPLIFLALPITRKMAKVRWAHIARAAWTPGLLLVLLLAARAMGYVFGVCYAGLYALVGTAAPNTPGAMLDPVSDPTIAHLSSVWTRGLEWACVIFVGWLILWWGFAIVRGWRIAQGWLVFGLLALAMVIGVVGLSLFVKYSVLGV